MARVIRETTKWCTMKREDPMDKRLLIAVAVLVGCGVIMIFCASAMRASIEHNSSTFFLRRQLFRVLLSAVAMVVVIGTDYTLLRRLTKVVLAVSFILFLVLRFSSLGSAAGGARRWVNLFSATFQPVEIFKLAFILFIADHLSKGSERLESIRLGLLPPAAVFLAASVFLLMQPDYGQVLIAGIILVTMLFLSGIRLRNLALLSAFIPPAAIAAWSIPHCRRRLLSFLHPGADLSGAGYQVHQSLIGLGCGGFTGCGLGQGKQKLLFLPDAHTDFLYSILGEELGLIGCLAVLGLFVYIFLRGVRIGLRALDSFGYLAATGISFTLLLHGLLHMGVCCGVLPTTGIPLPFLSYGGSSLLVSMIGVGVLLNISRQGTQGTMWRRNLARHGKQRHYGSSPPGRRTDRLSWKPS